LIAPAADEDNDPQKMTRRRWIADEFTENRAAVTGEHADHLVRVLRAHAGQEFDIAAGTKVHRGRVLTVADGRVEFELGEEVPASITIPVTLLLSIFKFDRMEWAIEKCTELGVSRIVPVIAHRTDAHLAPASAKRAERWRRIALQAAEQSRRSSAPQIAEPIRLQEAVGLSDSCRIVLAESEKQVHLRDAISIAGTNEMLLAVGPEGGWTEGELTLFRDKGWASASLGATILRAETAAIAATAILISELS
jgi:16S rRNA (uracil1498-N3)-methyltransferase